MAVHNETYGAAVAYVNKSLEGAGALKGAPCTISSITEITGGHRLTFEWEGEGGVTETSTMDVMDGVDGTNGTNGTDGRDGRDGQDGRDGVDGQDGVNGLNGTDGVGIVSIVYKNTDSSGNYVYTVNLSNLTSYDITCPKGAQGASYVLTSQDKTDIATLVLAELPVAESEVV